MTIARIQSFAFAGIEALPVEVQVQIASGVPAFLVVGLPDKAVGEARERVRAALTAMGLCAAAQARPDQSRARRPAERGQPLRPADRARRARGDGCDPPRGHWRDFAALGELSLDGGLNAVAGVLPAAIGASSRDLGLICPAAVGGEAAWAGRITVLAAPDLLSLINHFRGTQLLTPARGGRRRDGVADADLAEVRGMEAARRALEIAAAGGHNMMLIGPPGSGKSMLAARLPGLLPDLSPMEALEVSMIHSVAGMLDGGGCSCGRRFASRTIARARRR